jgi:hypothetical protein
MVNFLSSIGKDYRTGKQAATGRLSVGWPLGRQPKPNLGLADTSSDLARLAGQQSEGVGHPRNLVFRQAGHRGHSPALCGVGLVVGGQKIGVLRHRSPF